MSEKKKLVMKISKLKLPRLLPKKFKLDKQGRRRLLKKAGWVVLFLAVCFMGVAFGVYQAIIRHLPDITQLEEYKPNIITYIYAADGEVIGEYALQKRIPVSYHELPEIIIRAIVSTEDPRFFHHGGIDFRGILRAVKEDLRLIFTPQNLHGGSTITQQLMKRIFLYDEQTIRRKLKEAILALQMEKRYSKEEILTIYCNQFNLGHGAYGVEAAARLYFDKSALDLNLEEAAMITGIFRAPSRYSPYRNYDDTLGRRNHVLRRMMDEKHITREEYEEARLKPLNVLPLHRDDSEFASYFREEVRRYLKNNYGDEALYQNGLKVYTTLNLKYQRFAEEAARRQLHVLDKRQGWRQDKLNLLENGIESLEEIEVPLKLTIEGAKRNFLLSWRVPELEIGMSCDAVVLTVERNLATLKIKDFSGKMTNRGIEWTQTSDLRRLIKPGDLIRAEISTINQETMELTAVLDQEPLLETAFLAIEPQSGQIKAMVGGYSFRRSEYNMATQAFRQAGSVIKPFLYTAAIDTGISPSWTLVDEPTEFEDKWSGEIWDPPNYDEKYKGRITLRKAIEESRNIGTAKMLEHISPQLGVDYCRKFGFTSTIYPYLSLALGTFEVNMIELVSAFSTFPNGGIRVKPYFISRIEDKDGNILEENVMETDEVISPQVNYIMTSLLQGVVQRGTAQAARRLDKPLAGKTGTTDDWADARFVGFSPSLCAGVWVGRPEGRIPIGLRQSGAVAALPIWVEFFDRLIKDQKAMAEESGEELKEEEFIIPPNLSTAIIDYKTGLLPSPFCLPQFLITEYYLPGTEPNRICSNEDHMMTYDYYEYLKRQREEE